MKTIEISESTLKMFENAKQKSYNRRNTIQTDDEFLNSLVTVWNQSNWGK